MDGGAEGQYGAAPTMAGSDEATSCVDLSSEQAAGQEASSGNAEIQLSMFDKMRRMVSTDEEWDAILLQKMEQKRNREQGLPDPPQQPFSIGGAVGNVGAAIGNKVGGVLTKAKDVIPVHLPNIPIPGLNRTSSGNETVGEAAAAASQDYARVNSGISEQ